MSFYLYILRSLVDGNLYIGQTKNLPQRIENHNWGRVKSTRHRAPFELLHTEEFPTRGAAMKKEKYLKSLEGSVIKKAIVDKHRGNNSDC